MVAERHLNVWEKQRKERINEFVSGWTWERVVLNWRDRLEDFSISLNPLFTEICVYDPKFPTGREVELSWWPADLIRESQLDLQRHLDRHPGTIGPIHYYEIRKGELKTLYYLWGKKDNIEKVAAIFIMASLFTRLYNSRGNYPREEWPHYCCVEELYKWAYERCFGKKKGYGWHYSCTQVLPTISNDHYYSFRTMGSLIRYLAEEHALVLIKYRPVSINFSSFKDPFIEKALKEEYEVERLRYKKWEEENARRKLEEKRRKAEHPKWGQWSKITTEELQRLVWSKPTVELAKELGVSDVAIAKKCKAARIPKPPPGFWAKVKAGKIPHPQGKPPE